MKKNKNLFIVGVIAATKCDTSMGVSCLKKHGINNVISFVISNSPEEQTMLQKDQQALMHKVCKAIEQLIVNDAKSIFIYCNSLSGALDLTTLRKIFTIPIITPIDAYINLIGEYQRFGLIGANCQSVFNIEKIIVQHSSTASVVGFGSLELVKEVEKKKSPTKIINDFQLIEQCKVFKAHKCEVIFICCTHFNYFLGVLLNNLEIEQFPLEIIEPTQQMLNMIMRIKAEYAINHP